LGLALVYGVVQQSGGFIFVRSAPEQGSTFEIFFPEVRELAQSTSITLPSLPNTRGKETVLIVENDDVVRKMVAGILTADGYNVLAEKSGEDGLRVTKRSHLQIDLLITQIGGPSSEGEKLARALYESQPELRVLGTCNPDCYPLTFLPHDSQASLTKPFTLSALMKATRALLDHSAGRELTRLRGNS
jgi:two-component system, cell cycle sensor histidine kinase and response regulator CckA